MIEIAGKELPHSYIVPEVTEERQPANAEKAPGGQQRSCFTARLHRECTNTGTKRETGIISPTKMQQPKIGA